MAAGSTVLSEDMEQANFVSWFRKTYKDVRIFAIPNGGHRHIAVAAKLKVTGVCSGVPDLFVPEWRLWIEMKREKGGSVSAEQKDWLEYLNGCGYTAFVTKGCKDAQDKVLAFHASL